MVISIDSFNIKDTWGVVPAKDGFYNRIMKEFDVKDRIVVDTIYIDGSHVLLPSNDDLLENRTAKIKSQELTLQFYADKFTGYWDFMKYIYNQSFISMYVELTNETLKLEYLSCSEYKDVNGLIVFSVKFRESNPIDR